MTSAGTPRCAPVRGDEKHHRGWVRAAPPTSKPGPRCFVGYTRRGATRTVTARGFDSPRLHSLAGHLTRWATPRTGQIGWDVRDEYLAAKARAILAAP